MVHFKLYVCFDMDICCMMIIVFCRNRTKYPKFLYRSMLMLQSILTILSVFFIKYEIKKTSRSITDKCMSLFLFLSYICCFGISRLPVTTENQYCSYILCVTFFKLTLIFKNLNFVIYHLVSCTLLIYHCKHIND